MTSNTVVPQARAFGEDEFHDLAVACISEQIATHGREAVAGVMGITTRQLGNIMAGSSPAPHRVFNLRRLDPLALDKIDRKQGLRSVPRDATCSSDPVSAKLALLLSYAIEAERPESDGGPPVTLAELLNMPEAELRSAASKLAGWVERIDAYRNPPRKVESAA